MSSGCAQSKLQQPKLRLWRLLPRLLPSGANNAKMNRTKIAWTDGCWCQRRVPEPAAAAMLTGPNDIRCFVVGP